MSMKTLEAEILKEARQVTKKSKLRQKDIMEWTTGTIEPHDGEKIYFLPVLKVSIAILEAK